MAKINWGTILGLAFIVGVVTGIYFVATSEVRVPNHSQQVIWFYCVLNASIGAMLMTTIITAAWAVYIGRNHRT